MKNKQYTKQQGFTLIELLVVISIIALLSSIVLASVNSARTKANNAHINQAVIQYRNALELYRSNNPNYPTALPATAYCLGDYPGNPPATTCGLIAYPGLPIGSHLGKENAGLNSALLPYIPSLPPVSLTPVVAGAYSFLGALYTCSDVPCTGRSVYWALSGSNQTCIQGAGSDSAMYPGMTLCFLAFN